MRLPNELCKDIVHHITTKADLYNLILTYPALRYEAQRAMLRRIDMSTCGSEENNRKNRQTIIQTFEFLSRNISLAGAVRRLHYQTAVISDALLELLIPQMTNIKHLQFHITPAAHLDPMHSSFLRCSWRLYSFALLGVPLADPTNTISFLKARPTIVEFTMSTLSASLFTPEGILPHITTLSVYAPLQPLSLDAILLNRPITRMKVGALSQLAECGSSALQRIRVVSCFRAGNLPLPQFENLEFLEVCEVCYIYGMAHSVLI